MKNRKILQEAVFKAQENNYILPSAGIAWDLFEGRNEIDPTIINYIIFSQDFAKAFWGETTREYTEWQIKNEFNGLYLGSAWQYHLQQMVVLPDNEKLKYLEKFL